MKNNLRSVALAGFAEPSIYQANDSEADEVWSLNHAWRKDFKRLDRIIEIHPIEQLAWHGIHGGKEEVDYLHFQWLQKKHDVPIYTYQDYSEGSILDQVGPMLDGALKAGKLTEEAYQKQCETYKDLIESPPRIPSSVEYDFSQLDEIFEHLQRNNKAEAVYMTSSLSYMMALAILEGFDRVEVYGVEMGAGTEYAYQKAGLEMLVGYAMGKGIDVWFPDNCAMMNARPYHEGVQMISRQDLERHLGQYKQQFQDGMSRLNYHRGQAEMAKKEGVSKKKRKGMMKQVIEAQNLTFMAQTAVQVIENLILTIDYDDPLIQLVNKFSMGDPSTKELKKKLIKGESKDV